MYKVCAKVNDVSLNSVPLTPEFDLRINFSKGMKIVVGSMCQFKHEMIAVK